MGKSIYSSNDQLGGQMIMFPNGVSHALADNHLEALEAALSWLSYVPAVRHGFLSMVDITGVWVCGCACVCVAHHSCLHALFFGKASVDPPPKPP